MTIANANPLDASVTLEKVRLQSVVDRAGVLYGLLIAMDEMGVPAVEDEDLVFALTALLSEARSHANALMDALETVRN